jgi:hypothetical protein
MICVIKDCEAEAKKGEFHCMSHDEKKQAVQEPGQAGKYNALRKAKILACARQITLGWESIPQRTLVAATAAAISDGLRLKGQDDPTYDEVALVLRQAVDSGDLVSYEKNGTTFYKLPEPKVNEPAQVDVRQLPDSGRLVTVKKNGRKGAMVEESYVEPNVLGSDTRGGIHITQPVDIAGAQVSDTTFAWSSDSHIHGNTIVGAKVQDFRGDRIMLEPDVERTVDIDFPASVRHTIDEMLATGLYGVDFNAFVREAICARVREYVKGKK